MLSHRLQPLHALLLGMHHATGVYERTRAEAHRVVVGAETAQEGKRRDFARRGDAMQEVQWREARGEPLRLARPTPCLT